VKEVKASDVVKNIMKDWKEFPKFLDYVETTILNTVKETFVMAWTNSVLLIGCKTTNIVESTRGKLKKIFEE